MVGLAGQVDFRAGSATALPFADASFDAATLLHVGMNIADKPALFAGLARVLRPGGVFAIYDVMRTGGGDIDFPMPWATGAHTSFVAEPAHYRRALEAAGFEVSAERNRRDDAIAFFRAMRARLAESGPPPLGTHVLMGKEAPQKIANLIASLEAGRLAPVEMVCRRR
jgi:SAM-dependent methyltransferase